METGYNWEEKEVSQKQLWKWNQKLWLEKPQL